MEYVLHNIKEKLWCEKSLKNRQGPLHDVGIKLRKKCKLWAIRANKQTDNQLHIVKPLMLFLGQKIKLTTI